MIGIFGDLMRVIFSSGQRFWRARAAIRPALPPPTIPTFLTRMTMLPRLGDLKDHHYRPFDDEGLRVDSQRVDEGRCGSEEADEVKVSAVRGQHRNQIEG